MIPAARMLVHTSGTPTHHFEVEVEVDDTTWLMIHDTLIMTPQLAPVTPSAPRHQPPKYQEGRSIILLLRARRR